MSDPVVPHYWDPREGRVYVAARYAQMRCDGGMGRCALTPARAPFLMVPPKPLIVGRTTPLRARTVLHFCERHKVEMTVEILLASSIKANLERAAKAKWPHGVRPDFEKAWIDWVLVTTPEYRAFLEQIEIGKAVRRGENLV